MLTDNPRHLSTEWLVQIERSLSPDRVSVLNPLGKESPTFRQMYGSDRMALNYNAYAPDYASVLSALDSGEILHVLEIGILSGSGLAMWSKIFPDAAITGIDIEVSRCEANIEEFVELGAFKRSRPTFLELDATRPSAEVLAQSLNDLPRLSLVVDDGLHTIEAISTMIQFLQPYLDQTFTYIVEDNPGSFRRVRNLFADIALTQRFGGLVVASNHHGVNSC